LIRISFLVYTPLTLLLAILSYKTDKIKEKSAEKIRICMKLEISWSAIKDEVYSVYAFYRPIL